MTDAKKLINAINAANEKKTSPYDTAGIVKRLDGKTAWVRLDGGVDETPVRKTIACKPGDRVQVRVGNNGDAWITGNESAPPTDDADVMTVIGGLSSTVKENYKELQTLTDEVGSLDLNSVLSVKTEYCMADIAAIPLNADPSYFEQHRKTAWANTRYSYTDGWYFWRRQVIYFVDGTVKYCAPELDLEGQVEHEASEIDEIAQQALDTANEIAGETIPGLEEEIQAVNDVAEGAADAAEDITENIIPALQQTLEGEIDQVDQAAQTGIDDAKAMAVDSLTVSDEQRQIFNSTPTPPYYVGDLYYATNISKICIADRATGSYNADDWVNRTVNISKYNHFWYDQAGAHVSSVQGTTSGAGTNAVTIGSTGIIQTVNGKLASSWTNTGLNFYDINANTSGGSSTLMATFNHSGVALYTTGFSDPYAYFTRSGVSFYREYVSGDLNGNLTTNRKLMAMFGNTGAAIYDQNGVHSLEIASSGIVQKLNGKVASSWTVDQNNQASLNFYDATLSTNIAQSLIAAYTNAGIGLYSRNENDDSNDTNNYKVAYFTPSAVTFYQGNASDSLDDLDDGQRQIFSTEPIPPYYVGDIYYNATVSKICIADRETGSYNASDWEDIAINAKRAVFGSVVELYSGSGGSSSKGLKMTASGIVHLLNGKVVSSWTANGTGTGNAALNFYDGSDDDDGSLGVDHLLASYTKNGINLYTKPNLNATRNVKAMTLSNTGLTFWDPTHSTTSSQRKLATFGASGVELYAVVQGEGVVYNKKMAQFTTSGITFNNEYPFAVGNNSSYIKWLNNQIQIRASVLTIAGSDVATESYASSQASTAVQEYLTYNASGVNAGLNLMHSGSSSKLRIHSSGLYLYNHSGYKGALLDTFGLTIYDGSSSANPRAYFGSYAKIGPYVGQEFTSYTRISDSSLIFHAENSTMSVNDDLFEVNAESDGTSSDYWIKGALYIRNKNNDGVRSYAARLTTGGLSFYTNDSASGSTYSPDGARVGFVSILGHDSTVGTHVLNGNTKSLSSGDTWQDMDLSITLGAGSWIITYHGHWDPNASGKRFGVRLFNVTDNTAWTDFACMQMYTGGQGQIGGEGAIATSFTRSTTIKVQAYQQGGSNFNVACTISAIRVA